jgi:uncharacterized protein YndB with AHSA1/START domain
VLLARRIDAHPERVFDAFLDSERVAQWMLAGSAENEIVSVAIDPRVGGTFSFLVRSRGEEVEHLGGYVEIDRPRRLAFTWRAVTSREAPGAKSSGTLVTLDFAPAGVGTELRLTHEGVPEEQALRTEETWSKIIQALANSLGP